MLIHKIALIAAVAVLPGCVNPQYKFAENEKTAKLKVLHGNTVTICTKGKLYDLKKVPQQHYYLLPVSPNLVLSTVATYSGYQVTYSCYPRIGFTPEENQTYIADMNIVGERCVLDVAAEDLTTPTGLAPVTLLAPNCSAP